MHNFFPIAEKYSPMTCFRVPTMIIMGFFILLLSTTSCSKKRSSHKDQTKKSLAHQEPSVARLVDIPVPLGLTLTRQETTSHAIMLQFQGNNPTEQFISFYLQEMDRLGWKITNFSTQTNGMLLCEKNNRYCIIAITRKNKPTVTLHIKRALQKNKKKSLDINKKQLEIEL